MNECAQRIGQADVSKDRREMESRLTKLYTDNLGETATDAGSHSLK
jgi:hypothetical protein